MQKPAFQDGHFYSPVVNRDEVTQDQDRIWQYLPNATAIDLAPALHQHLLEKKFPSLLAEYQYEDNGPEDAVLDHFYESNGQFENLDPRALFCLMRLINPRRVIEIGSGYSTMLMVDVNKRFLRSRASITSIEPYPRPFLQLAHSRSDITLLKTRVQDADPQVFDQLDDGDMLFIDSSHVSKTGSDVNYIFLNVIPRLKPGVFVHLHDIFIPEEYPREWVIDQGRSWNEQYLLSCFLQFNSEFEVIFAAWYASQKFPDDVQRLVGGRRPVGGSFWMRRRTYGTLSTAIARAASLLGVARTWRP